jgi:CelD/BcsL family acetyltransferase involved in cellulose biosynthesis
MGRLRWYAIDDEGLRAEWDELAMTAAAGPFMRPGWFRAWERAFAGDRVEVAVLEDAGIHALAPLVRDQRVLRAAVNDHTPGFVPVARDEAAAARLANEVLREATPSVELRKVDGATARTWKVAAARRRSLVVEEVVQRSPFLVLDGDWEAFEKSLSSNFRQGLRRKRRRLEDEGDVTTEVHDGRTDLDALLTEGYAVESSQWKAERGTAIASDPRIEAFYTEVARWAAEQDMLRLVFLRIGGAAIAFRLDLVSDGTYFHVKGGYEPRYSRFSPGLVLQHETVRQAFEKGLDRYEFLGADEPYKLNWTKTVRERLALRCFSPTIRGRLGWAARAFAAPALRRARSIVGSRRHDPR